MTEEFFDDKEMDTMTLTQLDELGKEIFEQKRFCEDLDLGLSLAKAELQKLQAKMLAILDNFGRSNFTIPGEGMLIRSQRSTVTLPKTPEDKDSFYNYLKEKGIFEEIVSVNSNTLNAFYNREYESAMEEGRSVGFQIPGIALPTTIATLKMRKGK